MSKKYLSLDEAAQMLGVAREELTRLRERGDIRGFADRGTWKFKFEDVQNLGRSRQADSDPEVPMMLDDSSALSDAGVGSGSGTGSSGSGAGGSSIVLGGTGLANSDSDVRLATDAPGKGPGMTDSDSDVKLVGDGSDSDVKLVDDADSDSDVKLVGDETIRELNMAPKMSDSDSDVKLVRPEDKTARDKASDSAADRSDSDVQLLDDQLRGEAASDSDVAILGSDSDIALDFGSEDGESSSVLADESGMGLSGSGLLGTGSGISLEGPSDSGIALGGDDEGITLAGDKPDSGISLAGAESGISLAGGDSGISLSSADSGISLEAVADSGISLEDSNEFSGTVPMMNTVRDTDEGPETKFEMQSIRSDDSAFELQSRKGKGKGAATDETGVLDLSDSGEGSLDDAVFDLDEGDESSGEIADLEVADDVMGEDEEVEELDVFDADEGAFAGADEDDEMEGARIGRAMVPAEEEWGAGTLALLSFSGVISAVTGVLMFDLVRSMWMWGGRGEASGLLGIIKGMGIF
jgi:excisionase family DNA binding protein